MQTHGTSARGRAALGRAGWAVIAVAGLVLLVLGLAQKFYLGTVADAFERDRTGNTLILVGTVPVLAAALWSALRADPFWVALLVAAPAIVVGGLNLAAGNSLLPQIGALVAVPAGIAGIIGGLVAGAPRGR